MTGSGPVRRGGAADRYGFVAWDFDPPRFNASFGTIRTRAEPDGAVRVRFETGGRAANIHDRLHGGFALACVDQALPLAIATARGEPFGRVVTLSLSTSFMAAGMVDRPVDIVARLVGETGRLHFLAGEAVQADTVLLGWQATLRKVRA